MEVLEGIAADMVAGTIGNHEQFGGGNTTSALSRQQHLGMDGAERHGQLLANGGLPLKGERIGNPGDGGGDIGGMEGGKHQVAGFGRGHGDAHGFWIPHFADDDHVRSLAEGSAQGGREIGGVGTDFDLLDDAANVGVLVFDGVFNDDNVAGFAVIDLVDKGGHGGGLAGASRAAEEDQSAGQAGQVFDGVRKMEFAQGRHFGGERANGGCGKRPFAVEIDTETAEPGDAVGGVGDTGVAEDLEGMRGERGDDRRFDFWPIEDGVCNFADFAVLAYAGRSASDQEQVAAVAVDEGGEPVIEALGTGGLVGGGGLAAVEFVSDLIQVEGFVHKTLTRWVHEACRQP